MPESEQRPADEANLLLDSELRSEAQSTAKLTAFMRQRKTSKRVNAFAEHEASPAGDAAIAFINDNEFGWKANTCMLTKGHKDRAAHCDAPPDEVNLQTDSELENKKKFGEGEDFKTVLGNAQKFMKKYKTAAEIPISELPEDLDWTNYEGYDFMGTFRDQGACGSCYTVSFTTVVEARLKLKYGKVPEPLSPQQLMQCNYLNEGCDGGWSFFHGYLAENAYLVTEKCVPYKAKTKGLTCNIAAKCPAYAKLNKAYFLGGAYGEVTEESMMKELLRNGPINGELQVPNTFSMYQYGILSNDHEAKMSQYLQYSGAAADHKEAQQQIEVTSLAEDTDTSKGKTQSAAQAKTKASVQVSNRTIEDYGIAWMNLNHSVVIFGWGVDKKTGTKFWRIRNSYSA